MLTLTRQQLVDLGACGKGLDWFDDRSGSSGTIVYPNGFDSSEIERLALAQPKFLKWMAKKGLIPGLGLEQARQAVLDAHGEEAA